MGSFLGAPMSWTDRGSCCGSFPQGTVGRKNRTLDVLLTYGFAPWEHIRTIADKALILRRALESVSPILKNVIGNDE